MFVVGKMGVIDAWYVVIIIMLYVRYRHIAHILELRQDRMHGVFIKYKMSII